MDNKLTASDINEIMDAVLILQTYCERHDLCRQCVIDCGVDPYEWNLKKIQEGLIAEARGEL